MVCLGKILKKNIVVFIVDSNLNDVNNLKYKFNAYGEFREGDEYIQTYDFLFDINLNTYTK